MPRIMPRVDDQDDRRVQEFGQGRVAVVAIQLQAVIQAPVAFHLGDVGFLGMAREQVWNFLRAASSKKSRLRQARPVAADKPISDRYSPGP